MSKNNNKMVDLGFHLSIAHSMSNAPIEARTKGYGVFQLFVSSSRSWHVKTISKEEVLSFKQASESFKDKIFTHAPYLANPSSPDHLSREKSVNQLIGNAKNCEQIGIRYMVVHMGSHLGKGINEGISNLSKSISSIITATSSVVVLLENSAGYTNSVGSKMSEIGEALAAVDNKRIGVCIDTCHAFAAGYNIATLEGTKKLMEEVKEHIGINKVALVHFNDAKFECGSGLDRHWHIGKGRIGIAGFKNFFRQNTLTTSSYIMETPINEDGDNDYNFKAAMSILSEY